MADQGDARLSADLAAKNASWSKVSGVPHLFARER
jgi:hypothetical protein